MSPECHLMHTFHNSLSLSQGWMDHVHQCILARASRWLLPVIPHHSPVHCSWVGHGGVGQGQAGAPGSECLRLGPLVPQDEGLWLHVYGLRPAEGQRHRPLLDLHLLHHPHHRPGLHSVREADEGRKEGEKEEWKGGENWGGEERGEARGHEREDRVRMDWWVGDGKMYCMGRIGLLKNYNSLSLICMGHFCQLGPVMSPLVEKSYVRSQTGP